MTQIALIGIAAGAASALLFASFASGTLLSFLLFYLSPLPILLAGLGWSHLAALIAAFFASAALAFIFGSFFFISFLLGVGLPAWWLSYLALLARQPEGTTAEEDLEWYPLGRIVIWAALLSAGIVLLIMFTIATDIETLRASMRRAFQPLFRGEARLPKILIEYPDLVLPPAAAVLTTVITVFGLWLAGRIIRTSGRLRRPWPDISAMQFPTTVLPILALALAGSFLLSGMMALVANVVTAALLTAYGLLGLAVLHAITRPVSGRGFLLSGVYGAIFILGWPLLLMAMLGLADAALNLRARVAQPPPPPTT